MITGLMLRGVGSFDPPQGLTRAELDKIDNWQLVETVGLPVDEGDWAAARPAPRRQARPCRGRNACERCRHRPLCPRHQPLWLAPALPDGVPAPLWELPDPGLLVDEAAMELLPMLRQVAAAVPRDQAARTFAFTIQPPQNPAGDVMPASNPGTAALSPIGLLAMTAGFRSDAGGRAWAMAPAMPMRISRRSTSATAAFSAINGRSDWDWLITGLWEKGVDGQSDPVEYAALVPRPRLGLPAPTLADLRADSQAMPAPGGARWRLDRLGTRQLGTFSDQPVQQCRQLCRAPAMSPAAVPRPMRSSKSAH